MTSTSGRGAMTAKVPRPATWYLSRGMPWRNATLRGQTVLARVKADGSFDEKNGRVEIRYRATDARAYHARAQNLVAKDGPLLADAEVVTAHAAGGASKPGKPTATAPEHAGKGSWVAYTDGACTGNPGPAGSGTIVIAPGGKISESYAYLGEGTNNVAELTGILHALEATPIGEPLVVHTDSKYAIGVLSKGWKAKANGALIETIRKKLHGRAVHFVYVPGHAGVPLNERADELAREAIRTRSSHGGEASRT
jgi:ribonuclease HI